MLTAKEAREKATGTRNQNVSNLLNSCLREINLKAEDGKTSTVIYTTSQQTTARESVRLELIKLGYKVELKYDYDPRDGSYYWFEINW